MSAGTTPATSRSPEGDFSLHSPWSSFVEVVRGVMLEPSGFFEAIPRRGNLAGPALFALICLEVSVVLRGLLGLAGVLSEQGPETLIWQVLLTPVAGVLVLLAGTGVLHLLVRSTVGRGNSGFEATFRVHSYAWAVNLVAWIPLVGPVLSLYAIYLAFVGIREMHETTTGRAALVVSIPLCGLLLLALVFLMTTGGVL